MCASGFKGLIYSWELNAPAVYVPKDVGMMLPAGDTVVVEVHYNSVEKFKSGYSRVHIEFPNWGKL